MTDWLDTDVSAIGDQVRRGFAWWFGELADLLAPLTRPNIHKHLSVLAEQVSESEFRVHREGADDFVQTASSKRRRATLVLPAGVILNYEIWRPVLAPRDLRRLIRLEMDRLTPFSEESVYFDAAVKPQIVEDGRQLVQLVVAPRSYVDRLFSDAAAVGLEATAIVAFVNDEPIDFLPAKRQVDAPSQLRLRYAGWAILAVLAALNVAVAVWKDVSATKAMEAQVALQAPVVSKIVSLRQRVFSLQNQAVAQANARKVGEPLRVINELARVLPSGIWTERLSWDGTTVELSGQQRAGLNVIEALQSSPMFKNVRNAETSAVEVGDYDVTADVAPPAGAGR